MKQAIAVEKIPDALELTVRLCEHTETAPAIGPSPVRISTNIPLLDVALAFANLRELGVAMEMPGINGRFTAARVEMPSPRIRVH